MFQRSSGNIDINSFETAITKQTAAILVPHLHGIPADAASIRKLCDANKILFIEDVAQANGSGLMAKELVRLAIFRFIVLEERKNINSFFAEE